MKQRDFVSHLQKVGIAQTVFDFEQTLAADPCMRLHAEPLFFCKCSGFPQDGVLDADLSDVVQGRAEANQSDEFVGDRPVAVAGIAGGFGQSSGQDSDSIEMPFAFPVFRVSQASKSDHDGVPRSMQCVGLAFQCSGKLIVLCLIPTVQPAENGVAQDSLNRADPEKREDH